MENDIKKDFAEHKIIASESKSWYAGKPGTTNHSFSVTWSPGALMIYGKNGNLTLIFSEFSTYDQTKKWMSRCNIEDFKGVVAHNIPENVEYFFEACKFWGNAPHYV